MINRGIRVECSFNDWTYTYEYFYSKSNQIKISSFSFVGITCHFIPRLLLGRCWGLGLFQGWDCYRLLFYNIMHSIINYFFFSCLVPGIPVGSWVLWWWSWVSSRVLEVNGGPGGSWGSMEILVPKIEWNRQKWERSNQNNLIPDCLGLAHFQHYTFNRKHTWVVFHADEIPNNQTQNTYHGKPTTEIWLVRVTNEHGWGIFKRSCGYTLLYFQWFHVRSVAILTSRLSHTHK